jgi:hypothetical protein
VPLTLEGPTRTMRGLGAVTFRPAIGALGASVMAWPLLRVARHRGVTAGTGCGWCRGGRARQLVAP